jgi:hypothetical protein
MFLIWWGSKTYQRNIASESIECSICETTKIHTYRLYETKRKIYSVIPVGTSKLVTLICHGCLTEQKLGKIYEKELIEKIDRWENKITTERAKSTRK